VVVLPEQAKSQRATLCLRQKIEVRSGNEWAVDSFRLIEEAEVFHYYVQFSINLACDVTMTPATYVTILISHPILCLNFEVIFKEGR